MQTKAVVDAEVRRDENDPIWKKENADKMLLAGNYEGAFRAYSDALKDHIHPAAFANRGLAAMYLGALAQCIDDCTRALQTLN